MKNESPKCPLTPWSNLVRIDNKAGIVGGMDREVSFGGMKITDFLSLDMMPLKIMAKDFALTETEDKMVALLGMMNRIEMIETPRRKDITECDGLEELGFFDLSSSNGMIEIRIKSTIFVEETALRNGITMLPRGDTLACHIVATRCSLYLIDQREDLIPWRLIADEAEMSARENTKEMAI